MPKTRAYNSLWLRKATGLPSSTSYQRGKAKQVLIESSSNANKLAARITNDVYRVDLSQVVSKYITETEKNLEAIFREAEAKKTVLLFDEADALFGKRTDVRDAHDRYAMKAAPILKRLLKSHKGVTIIGLKQCGV